MKPPARVLRGLGAVPRKLLIGGVKGYRFFLKPWLGNACRFEPTCSAYALEALERHGAAAGACLAGARLLRCHPWCHGGVDPVPNRPPALFSRLLGSPGRQDADGTAQGSEDPGPDPRYLERKRRSLPRFLAPFGGRWRRSRLLGALLTKTRP